MRENVESMASISFRVDSSIDRSEAQSLWKKLVCKEGWMTKFPKLYDET